MPVVLRTPLARADLLAIWEHISVDSAAAADDFIDTLEEKCALLATQPLMGASRTDLGDRVRSFAVGDYLLFYLPLADGIEVLRVIHGARDVPAIFYRNS